MPEMFGCCGSYRECSNAGYCIKSSPAYAGCYYRKNLENGRNFYRTKKEYKIYLSCYNHLFAILYRHDLWKSAVSYQLKPEQHEKVKTLFNNLEIPYVENLNNIELKKEKQISDCRVVIEAGEEKYHILNYNSYLIPEKYAEGIRKAFEAKGIPARVEKVGQWRAVNILPWEEKDQMIAVDNGQKLDTKPKPEPVEIAYEQASIFDLMGA